VVRGLQAEYTALGADTNAMQTSYVLRLGVKMLLVTLIMVGSAIIVGYLVHGLQQVLRAIFVKRCLAELNNFL